MPLVTDVTWHCPGCQTENTAQLYDWHYKDDDDYGENPMEVCEIPSNASLKSNPACKKCGEFRLSQINTFKVDEV